MIWLYAFLAMAGAAALAGMVWRQRRRAALARLGTLEDIQARARRGGYRLIDTAELARLHLTDNGRLLLVDTRPWPSFQDGHLQDAVSFPLAPTWRARRSCRKALAALLGPDKNRTLVFY